MDAFSGIDTLIRHSPALQVSRVLCGFILIMWSTNYLLLPESI